jgi:uncharacterized membrane protein HdeD (DUF308 family)
MKQKRNEDQRFASNRETGDPAENKPLVLDYAKDADKSSWPAGLYVGALVWAFLTLSVFTPSLDGQENNAARMRAQVALLACATLRLAWALHRKEKGKGWKFYVVLLALAAPIWLLVEQPLWSLGRALWGRGLNP